MKKILLCIGVLIVCVIAGFLVWTQFYYVAEPNALAAVMNNHDLRIAEDDTTITLVPVNGATKYTFIFYPGAKVDAHAYLAKLGKIAIDHDMKIIISKPPLHLQIFAINAAADIAGDHLIIGGHSLGGSMACEYVASHPEKISGMILFGAYCNSDITWSGIKTLIMAASHDGVLPPDTINSYRHNLPADNMLSVIDGAVHAQFGDYGPQKGDGTSTLTDEEVVGQMSEQIGIFLKSIEK